MGYKKLTQRVNWQTFTNLFRKFVSFSSQRATILAQQRVEVIPSFMQFVKCAFSHALHKFYIRAQSLTARAGSLHY